MQARSAFEKLLPAPQQPPAQLTQRARVPCSVLAWPSLLELESEVWGSKGDLEDLLGTAVRHFAYPHHSFDGDVVEVVREAGYDGAAGGHEGTHVRFNLHRIDAARIGRPILGLRLRGVDRRVRRLPVPSPVRKLLGAIK